MNDTAIHDTLTVQVVYLARLREAFGTSGERLPLRRGADAVTVADVLSTLAARGGIYATELASGRAVRIEPVPKRRRPDREMAIKRPPVEEPELIGATPPRSG